jgi:hypothetical protein
MHKRYIKNVRKRYLNNSEMSMGRALISAQWGSFKIQMEEKEGGFVEGMWVVAVEISKKTYS